jgi:hypothetical protein
MADTPVQLKPVALNSTAHKGLKVKQTGSTDHLKDSHLAKVTFPEFTRAGIDAPIIFIQDHKGLFSAAVMWGLDIGENLFIDNGKWSGGYVPAYVRAFPFATMTDPEKLDLFYIGLFEDSEFVNREEGELILNEDGTETEWMNGIKDFLITIYNDDQLTKNFAEKLNELNLLAPQALTVRNPDTGETIEKGGFYIVLREKLAQLPEAELIELAKNGGLELIHAHLMSLHALDNLVKRKEDRLKKTTSA